LLVIAGGAATGAVPVAGDCLSAFKSSSLASSLSFFNRAITRQAASCYIIPCNMKPHFQSLAPNKLLPRSLLKYELISEYDTCNDRKHYAKRDSKSAVQTVREWSNLIEGMTQLLACSMQLLL
jgi:hypothetical protein